MRFRLPIPRRKWSRRIAVAVMGTALWGMSDVIDGYAMYEDAYNRAQGVGAIVTAEDMQRLSSVPEGNNAAALLADPLIRYDSASRHRDYKLAAELIPWRTCYRLPTTLPVAKTIAYLKPYDAILDDLAPSLTKSRCDFGYDWEKGYDLGFPQFGTAKNLAQLLCVRARLFLHEGRTAEAVSQFRIAVHLAKLLNDTPIDIATLVSISMQDQCLVAMQDCLAANPENRTLRTEFRKLASGLRTTVDRKRLLNANLYFAWNTAENVGRWVHEDDGCGTTDYLRSIAWIPGMQQSWRTRVLENLIRVKQATMDHPDSNTDVLLPARTQTFGLSFRLADLVEVWPTKYQPAIVRLVVKQQLLFALADLLDYRQANRKWPDALPSDRMDPYTMQPLRYVKKGDEISVYSLGDNGRDEWQAALAPKSNERSDDKGFVLSLAGR